MKNHPLLASAVLISVCLAAQAVRAENVKIGGFSQVQFADGSAPGNHLGCKIKRARL